MQFLKIKNKNDKKYWWLVGFTDGDGTFVALPNKLNRAIAFKLRYHIHKDDKICLENINKILNLNVNIYENNTSNTIEINIIKQSHLNEKVIPIFNKYPLITIKYLGYKKWVEQYIEYIN